MPTRTGTPTQGEVTTTGSSLTYSYTLVTGSDRRLFVGVMFDDTGASGATVSSVTYNGVALALVSDGTTSAVETVATSNTTRSEVWSLIEASLPTNAPHDVVITMSQDVDAIISVTQQLDDAEQGDIHKVETDPITTGGSTFSTSITTTVDGAMILSNIAGSSGGVWTATAPNTLVLGDTNSSNSGAMGYYDQASAGTQAMAWTVSGGQARVAHVIVAVLAPGGGPVIPDYTDLYIEYTGDAVMTLVAEGDGTISNVVNENDNTTNLWDSVDDTPASPNDADWINNTAAAASTFIDLSATLANFESMSTMSVTFRIGVIDYTADISVYAQLFQSDESTSLSDEMLIETVSADAGFANDTEVTFTGVNTSASKAVWDAAKIRIRWA